MIRVRVDFYGGDLPSDPHLGHCYGQVYPLSKADKIKGQLEDTDLHKLIIKGYQTPNLYLYPYITVRLSSNYMEGKYTHFNVYDNILVSRVHLLTLIGHKDGPSVDPPTEPEDKIKVCEDFKGFHICYWQPEIIDGVVQFPPYPDGMGSTIYPEDPAYDLDTGKELWFADTDNIISKEPLPEPPVEFPEVSETTKLERQSGWSYWSYYFLPVGTSFGPYPDPTDPEKFIKPAEPNYNQNSAKSYWIEEHPAPTDDLEPLVLLATEQHTCEQDVCYYLPEPVGDILWGSYSDWSGYTNPWDPHYSEATAKSEWIGNNPYVEPEPPAGPEWELQTEPQDPSTGKVIYVDGAYVFEPFANKNDGKYEWLTGSTSQGVNRINYISRNATAGPENVNHKIVAYQKSSPSSTKYFYLGSRHEDGYLEFDNSSPTSGGTLWSSGFDVQSRWTNFISRPANLRPNANQYSEPQSVVIFESPYNPLKKYIPHGFNPDGSPNWGPAPNVQGRAPMSDGMGGNIYYEDSPNEWLAAFGEQYKYNRERVQTEGWIKPGYPGYDAELAQAVYIVSNTINP